MRIARGLAAALVLILVFAIAVPSRVAADNPAHGQLLVAGDHHLPGDTMQITGYDLDPGVDLTFMLQNGAYGVTLVEATVGADGTVSATATVPVNFPTGYAEVVGTGAGNTWRTVVLIGERAEGPDAQPLPIDDRVIGLTLAGIGTLLFLIAAAWYIRSRPKGSAGPR